MCAFLPRGLATWRWMASSHRLRPRKNDGHDSAAGASSVAICMQHGANCLSPPSDSPPRGRSAQAIGLPATQARDAARPSPPWGYVGAVPRGDPGFLPEALGPSGCRVPALEVRERRVDAPSDVQHSFRCHYPSAPGIQYGPNSADPDPSLHHPERGRSRPQFAFIHPKFSRARPITGRKRPSFMEICLTNSEPVCPACALKRSPCPKNIHAMQLALAPAFFLAAAARQRLAPARKSAGASKRRAEKVPALDAVGRGSDVGAHPKRDAPVNKPNVLCKWRLLFMLPRTRIQDPKEQTQNHPTTSGHRWRGRARRRTLPAPSAPADGCVQVAAFCWFVRNLAWSRPHPGQHVCNPTTMRRFPSFPPIRPANQSHPQTLPVAAELQDGEVVVIVPLPHAEQRVYDHPHDLRRKALPAAVSRGGVDDGADGLPGEVVPQRKAVGG